jgi:hypothetical protein
LATPSTAPCRSGWLSGYIACLFSVIDSSTRKSASSRDSVAIPGLGGWAAGAAGVEAAAGAGCAVTAEAPAGAEGPDGAGGGAPCDGFVIGWAYEYASTGTGKWSVAAALQYSPWVRGTPVSKLLPAEAKFFRWKRTHTRRVGGSLRY